MSDALSLFNAVNVTMSLLTPSFFPQGYDHGYYFISSFIEEHFTFMAKHIC